MRTHVHIIFAYMTKRIRKKRIPYSPALLFLCKLQLEEGSLLQRLFEIFHYSMFVVEISKFFKNLKHSDFLRLKNNTHMYARCKTKKKIALIYLSFPFQYIKMRKIDLNKKYF